MSPHKQFSINANIRLELQHLSEPVIAAHHDTDCTPSHATFYTMSQATAAATGEWKDMINAFDISTL